MSAAPTKLSATILLIRDRDDLEVLIVTRHYQIDFAAGALVFPGGKIVDDDRSSDWDVLVDGAYTGNDRIARIGAARETFEESGLLLARPSEARGEGAALVGADVCDMLAPYREAVDRGDMLFSKLLHENGLVLALDTLIHFGHWITPDMMPKRFDTHFYIAAAPPEQIAAHDGRETTDAVWINPDAALQMAERGDANIIFPTRMNLRKLCEASDTADAHAKFAETDVVTVLPIVGKDDEGRPCLHIPSEAGYGVTTELLENVKV